MPCAIWIIEFATKSLIVTGVLIFQPPHGIILKTLKGGDPMADLIVAGTGAQQKNHELPENFIELALADLLKKGRRAKQNSGYDKPLKISYSLTDKPCNESPLVGTLTLEVKI
jgi:hypothetical protein